MEFSLIKILMALSLAALVHGLKETGKVLSVDVRFAARFISGIATDVVV